MGWMAEARFSEEARDFSLIHSIYTGCKIHPPKLVPGGYFVEDKAAGA
jgi:hypothetical protein